VFKTIRQVARYLDISESLVRRLVAQGVCPGVYSGNRFLVNVEALREYLEAESRQVKEVQA
jgi:excisionase family DNA binding protein